MGVATPPVDEMLLVKLHVSTFWLELEPPVARRKADIGGVAADDLRDIDRPRLRELSYS